MQRPLNQGWMLRNTHGRLLALETLSCLAENEQKARVRKKNGVMRCRKVRKADKRRLAAQPRGANLGWAELRGRSYRVGGWGLPVSDEGSGAWLGCEALRRVLWAQDGRIPWTGLLTALVTKFTQKYPRAVVHVTQTPVASLQFLEPRYRDLRSRNVDFVVAPIFEPTLEDVFIHLTGRTLR